MILPPAAHADICLRREHTRQGAPAVLASEAYRRFVEAALPPAGGAVTHLVLDTAVPPERPLFVASERYLRLLHAIDPDFFPPSAAPYPAVLLHSSAKTAKLTPKPHPLLPGTAPPIRRFSCCQRPSQLELFARQQKSVRWRWFGI